MDYKLSEGSSTLLDLIRGVSAQLVVIGHGISFFLLFPYLKQHQIPHIQNIAVLVFFLLSGFLITYSVARKLNYDPSYSFKHYLIDRFSRIYCAFIPALLFVLSLDLLSRNLNPESYRYEAAFNVKTFLGNIFMLQDFPFTNDAITSFGSARPFWTLAIEWWIYIFFGFLFLFINKRRNLSILTTFIFLLFAIVPLFNLINGRGNGLTLYWIFGSMIYLFSNQNFTDKISTKGKWTIVVLLISLSFYRIYLTRVEYEPIFAFLLAAILLFLIDLFAQIKFPPFLTQLIKINAGFSYTLYLIHYSILDFLSAHFHNKMNPHLLLLFGFTISNIISFGIGLVSEEYLTQKIKIKLYKSYIFKGKNEII